MRLIGLVGKTWCLVHANAQALLINLSVISALQVMRGRAAVTDVQAATPVEALYDIVWQAERPTAARAKLQRSSRARVQWQASSKASAGKENAPRTMQSSANQKSLSRALTGAASVVSPAGAALSCVAWLQSTIKAAKPGTRISLRTRGALSFPLLQEPAGASPCTALFTSASTSSHIHTCLHIARTDACSRSQQSMC